MNPYQNIIDILKANSINYIEVDHEPIYSNEESGSIEGLSLESGAKSILLKTKDRYVLVVLSGSKRIDSKRLKKTLGIKEIRFASPAEVKHKMGCIVGSCYPFGRIANVETYLDNSLLSKTSISFNPGLHDKSIKININDYVRLEKPIVINISIG